MAIWLSLEVWVGIPEKSIGIHSSCQQPESMNSSNFFPLILDTFKLCETINHLFWQILQGQHQIIMAVSFQAISGYPQGSAYGAVYGCDCSW